MDWFISAPVTTSSTRPAGHNGPEIQIQRNVLTRSIVVQMCQQFIGDERNAPVGPQQDREQQGVVHAGPSNQDFRTSRFMKRLEMNVQANVGVLKTSAGKVKDDSEEEEDLDLLNAVQTFSKLYAAKRKSEEDFPSMKTREQGRYDAVRDVVVEDVDMEEQPETKTVKAVGRFNLRGWKNCRQS